VPAEERFVSVARRFLSLVEGFEAHPRDEFICVVEPVLVDLYGSALGLGRGATDDDGGNWERMDMSEWWDLFQRLGQHLGSYDAYDCVFDPYDLGSQPVRGLVSDDLADICRDLREGLDLYDAGRTDEAVWQWRFGFDSHWGQHATHALYALRTLRADRGL